MPSETIIQCPFCGKLTITILHIPFVSKTISSKTRAGGRETRIQKERYDVLSGCSECRKSQKEVEKALNTGKTKEIPHEERLRRIKEAGLPTRLEY